MDLPKPPDDPDLKNIIDKLANFVARNGADFENMTKQKQKDNPKFEFLFGGPNFNYYQFRVTTEQAILKNQMKHQQQQGPPLGPGYSVPPLWHTGHPGPNLPVSMAGAGPPPPLPQPNIQLQIQQMQAQITQSEQNLAAQYATMIQQQQIQIDEHVRSKQEETLLQLCQECGVSREEIDGVVQPIIEACTKDAISNGKNWIFSHCSSRRHCDLITHYLLVRVTRSDAPFTHRLHLIYLVNDVLHHCTRKNAEDLKEAIENVLVGIFSTAHHTVGIDQTQQQKLGKLLILWSNNKYFQPSVLNELKDPVKALQTFKKTLEGEHQAFISGVCAATQQQYGQLQKQHQDFVNHMNGQIQALQQQALQQQQAPPVSQPMSYGAQGPGIHGPIMHGPPPGLGIPNIRPPISGAPNHPPPNFDPSQPPPNMNLGPPPPMYNQAPSYQQQPGIPPRMGWNGGPNIDYQVPSSMPPQSSAPFTRPPMTFSQNPNAMPPLIPPPEPDLTPNVPYYELPAGLMAPLVKLEDCDYEAIDPKVMRLPPPMPPSDRLLAAVEAFYSQPTHERPRDSEGWEKLGLYEFFRAKQKAKRTKEENGTGNRKPRQDSFREERSRSRSQSPDQTLRPRRRRFDSERDRLKRSRSRSSSPGGANSPSRPHSRGRDRSRSRSWSPRNRRSHSPPPKRTRSRSEERKSRSPATARGRSRSRSPVRRSRSKSRSKSKSPPGRSFGRRPSRSRSPTPEFTSARFPVVPQVSLDTALGSDNIGHMLMKKMGWGGGGLGQAEQGIVEPIRGGEVRDRSDMFKGIGLGSDPFEQFRKNQSQGFISRMKSRDDGTEKPAGKKRPRKDVPVD